MRLSQAARKFNVSTETIVDFLHKKKNEIDPNPNSKLTTSQLQLIAEEFSKSAAEKEKSRQHTKEATQKIAVTTAKSAKTPKKRHLLPK